MKCFDFLFKKVILSTARISIQDNNISAYKNTHIVYVRTDFFKPGKNLLPGVGNTVKSRQTSVLEKLYSLICINVFPIPTRTKTTYSIKKNSYLFEITDLLFFVLNV
jgi:hypothetical protein